MGHLLYSLEPFIELLRKTRDRLFRYCEPWLGADGKSPREQEAGTIEWYIYSCYDLRAYLETRFGYAKKFKGGFADVDLSGVKGVILFGSGTAISGMDRRSRYNTDFTDGTKTVSEIRVSETPS